MATWKRLTGPDGALDVNMDHVCWIARHGEVTALHFVGGTSDGAKSMVNVKEKPDEIHMGKNLRST